MCTRGKWLHKNALLRFSSAAAGHSSPSAARSYGRRMEAFLLAGNGIFVVDL